MKSTFLRYLVLICVSTSLLFGAAAPSRIKDLTTTATSPYSDDYMAIDGTTNNTRRILASRMFGLGPDGNVGDATVGSSGTTLTFNTVNANVGVFGNATTIPAITVNAKGLITAVTNVTASGGGAGLVDGDYGDIIVASSGTTMTLDANALILTPNAAMGALVIDVSKPNNTKTISANSTLTFSGTPAAGTTFGLTITNSDSGVNYVLTIPSSYSTKYNATITSLPIEASQILKLWWFYNGATYHLFGEPFRIFDLPSATPITSDRIPFHDVSTGLDGKVTISTLVNTVLAASPTLTTPTIGVATGTSLSTTRQAHGNAGATETFDLANGDTHTATLDANLTVTLTGWAASGKLSSMLIGLTQDATGGRTVTWPAAVVTAPTVTTTANAITWVQLWTEDGGTTIYASGTADGVPISSVSGLGTGVAAAAAISIGSAGAFATSNSTTTLTEKTFDASASGNVLKQYGYLILTHPTVFGSGVTQQTTVTSPLYGQALFSNSTDKATNYVEYILTVPDDIDTSVDLTGKFKFILGGADTGDHEYEISMIDVAGSAVYDGSPADAVSLTYTADGSGADKDVETAGAPDTLTGWAAAVAAGNYWRIRVARDGDHASDTSTVNSYSGPLVIRYGITQ